MNNQDRKLIGHLDGTGKIHMLEPDKPTLKSTDYKLWVSFRKAGRYNGRYQIATLTSENKMDELSQVIHEWCSENNVNNVAIDLYASINFALEANLFDVAREFPNVKPKTFVFFYVQREYATEPKAGTEWQASDIPF